MIGESLAVLIYLTIQYVGEIFVSMRPSQIVKQINTFIEKRCNRIQFGALQIFIKKIIHFFMVIFAKNSGCENPYMRYNSCWTKFARVMALDTKNYKKMHFVSSSTPCTRLHENS